jgi:hypothetical protein
MHLRPRVYDSIGHAWSWPLTSLSLHSVLQPSPRLHRGRQEVHRSTGLRSSWPPPPPARRRAGLAPLTTPFPPSIKMSVTCRVQADTKQFRERVRTAACTPIEPSSRRRSAQTAADQSLLLLAKSLLALRRAQGRSVFRLRTKAVAGVRSPA